MQVEYGRAGREREAARAAEDGAEEREALDDRLLRAESFVRSLEQPSFAVALLA